MLRQVRALKIKVGSILIVFAALLPSLAASMDDGDVSRNVVWERETPEHSLIIQPGSSDRVFDLLLDGDRVDEDLARDEILVRLSEHAKNLGITRKELSFLLVDTFLNFHQNQESFRVEMANSDSDYFGEQYSLIFRDQNDEVFLFACLRSDVRGLPYSELAHAIVVVDLRGSASIPVQQVSSWVVLLLPPDQSPVPRNSPEFFELRRQFERQYLFRDTEILREGG